MSTTEHNLTITLTADWDRQKQLHAKLAEYEKRNEYNPPEVYAHETYKQWVLERLLKDGHAELNELVTEYAKLSWYKPHALWSAFMIIKKYNDDDLEGLVGGTGLK